MDKVTIRYFTLACAALLGVSFGKVIDTGIEYFGIELSVGVAVLTYIGIVIVLLLLINIFIGLEEKSS